MRFLDIIGGRAGELRKGKRDGAVAFEGLVVSELIALHPQPDDGLLIHTRDEHKSLIRLGQGLLNGLDFLKQIFSRLGALFRPRPAVVQIHRAKFLRCRQHLIQAWKGREDFAG